jgi:hypothetical protein
VPVLVSWGVDSFNRDGGYFSPFFIAVSLKSGYLFFLRKEVY